ncbi:MAG: PH domain-containing protein, partial [Rhodoglobus sp.]
ALVAVIGVIIVNARDFFIDLLWGSADEYEPFARLVNSGFLVPAILIVIAVLFLSVLGFYLSWRMHSFRITDELVEVRSGILFRTNRRGRLDRIQGINISRPLFARLFGAAKLEVNVAGQDANVELSYLTSRDADDLRRTILLLASGSRAEEKTLAADASDTGAGVGAGVAIGESAAGESAVGESAAGAVGHPGLIEQRVHELFAPELDPDAAPPESIVRIRVPRLIGSLLLSEATIIAVAVAIGLIVAISITGELWFLFAFLPGVLGLAGYLTSRLTRSLRYSIAATDDGIRVGYGLLSTTNDTLPPGRIHAIEVLQPLLWRAAGWWEIRINTASRASGSGQALAKTTLLPVGDITDVHRVLQLIMPNLADEHSRGMLEVGLGAAATDDGFVTSPKRAAVLRWFSWRRNGIALISDVVALRKGAIWRSLVLVPEARLQSVSMGQGPLLRRLGLAELRVHTVAGPISATIGALDRDDVIRFFDEISRAAVQSAAVDTSHRWRSSSAATSNSTTGTNSFASNNAAVPGPTEAT